MSSVAAGLARLKIRALADSSFTRPFEEGSPPWTEASRRGSLRPSCGWQPAAHLVDLEGRVGRGGFRGSGEISRIEPFLSPCARGPSRRQGPGVSAPARPGGHGRSEGKPTGDLPSPRR